MKDGNLIPVKYDLEKPEAMEGRIEELIRANASFRILGVRRGKQGSVVDIVERAIEAQGKSCRVRTNGRGIAAAALAIPTLGGSIAASGAIAVHNLATRNPDYEVIKDMFGTDVRVIYFKKRSFIDSITGEM